MSVAKPQPLANRVRGTIKGHAEEIENGWIAKGMKDDLVKMTWKELQLN